MPRNKIYIVSSPDLISAVDRRSKTISFAPYVVQFAKRILVPSQHGIDTLGEDLLEEHGAVGLRPETLSIMHHSLAPGEDLLKVTRVMLESASWLLQSPEELHEDGKVNLFEWVRQFVTKASTDAIYGAKQNPFQDPAVYNGFWYVCRSEYDMGYG